MTLHELINFAVDLAEYAIPAALFAWADRAWTPAAADAAPTTPRTPRS